MALRQRVAAGSGDGGESGVTASASTTAGALPRDYDYELARLGRRSGFVAGVKQLQVNLGRAMEPGAAICFDNIRVVWLFVVVLALVLSTYSWWAGPYDAMAGGARADPRAGSPTSPTFCYTCSAAAGEAAADVVHPVAAVAVLSGCGRGAARDAVRATWGAGAVELGHSVRFVMVVTAHPDSAGCLAAARAEAAAAGDLVVTLVTANGLVDGLTGTPAAAGALVMDAAAAAALAAAPPRPDAAAGATSPAASDLALLASLHAVTAQDRIATYTVIVDDATALAPGQLSRTYLRHAHGRTHTQPHTKCTHTTHACRPVGAAGHGGGRRQHAGSTVCDALYAQQRRLEGGRGGGDGARRVGAGAVCGGHGGEP